MWVKLNCNQHITRQGVMTTHHAGDWVNVGRHIAQQWIDGGCAVAIDPDTLDQSIHATSGIVVRGQLDEDWRGKFTAATNLQLAFSDPAGPIELPFTETLIWSPCDLRLDLLAVGFNLLKRWQVVVPLYDYETLAVNVGSQANRDAAVEVLRDLRVPLRDTRAVFVRRCEATRQLITEWNRLREEYTDERLAFLQALYTVKPVVCDVPASWTGHI